MKIPNDIIPEKDYINAFKYLMQEREFKRTLNAYSMNYFISKIKKDYSGEKLKL